MNNINREAADSSTEKQEMKQGFNDKSLPSDGPVSKNEGTASPDLDENDTAKSFDRDQEELNYGFKDGDLDTDTPDKGTNK